MDDIRTRAALLFFGDKSKPTRRAESITHSQPFPMKSTSLFSLATLAIALVGVSSSRAGTIIAPTADYTIDYTKTGGMTLNTWGNLIQFSHESVYGLTLPDNNLVSGNGHLMALFQATPGKIFDRLSFLGLSGGGAQSGGGAGGVFSTIDWQVNGGTFVEGAPSAGSANTYPYLSFARQWEITDHTTGSGSSYFVWNAYGGIAYDFNNPLLGSGYYSIGAESFSMDITALVEAWTAAGNPWPPSISPQTLNFGVSFLDAPTPPAAVPEAASTAGLMLLALSGMVSVRRFARARQG